MAELYKLLAAVDPAGAAIVKPTDTTRVRRAYEIFRGTGISVADWFTRPMIKNFPIPVFCDQADAVESRSRFALQSAF